MNLDLRGFCILYIYLLKRRFGFAQKRGRKRRKKISLWWCSSWRNDGLFRELKGREGGDWKMGLYILPLSSPPHTHTNDHQGIILAQTLEFIKGGDNTRHASPSILRWKGLIFYFLGKTRQFIHTYKKEGNPPVWSHKTDSPLRRKNRPVLLVNPFWPFPN